MLSAKACSSYTCNCFSKGVFNSTYLWSQFLLSSTQRTHRHGVSPASSLPSYPGQIFALPAYLLGRLFFILLLLTTFPLTTYFLMSLQHNLKLCLTSIIKSTSTMRSLTSDKSFYQLVSSTTKRVS